MSFRPKAADWRLLPTEVRELLLDTLHKRAQLGTLEKLTPVELARRCGFEQLDSWQIDVLNSTERQIILNCSRQSGKSTVTALLGLHTALFKPGSLVLILAPSQRQSAETYRKVRDFYGQLAGVPEATQESSLKLELANGSRIQVLPGKEQNVRGFSGVSLLIIDESARVEDSLYQALRPMLAVSGGRVVLLSTPAGRRGFFWTEWDQGHNWKRVRVPASQCPRIDPAWLEEERQRIGDFWYQQEYEIEFLDSVTSVFRTEDFDNAIDTEVKAIWPSQTFSRIIMSRRMAARSPGLVVLSD